MTNNQKEPRTVNDDYGHSDLLAHDLVLNMKCAALEQNTELSCTDQLERALELLAQRHIDLARNPMKLSHAAEALSVCASIPRPQLAKLLQESSPSVGQEFDNDLLIIAGTVYEE